MEQEWLLSANQDTISSHKALLLHPFGFSVYQIIAKKSFLLYSERSALYIASLSKECLNKHLSKQVSEQPTLILSNVRKILGLPAFQ